MFLYVAIEDTIVCVILYIGLYNYVRPNWAQSKNDFLKMHDLKMKELGERGGLSDSQKYRTGRYLEKGRNLVKFTLQDS